MLTKDAKRVCTNPDCRKDTKDPNETICVRCGWVTMEVKKQVVTKGKRNETALGE